MLGGSLMHSIHETLSQKFLLVNLSSYPSFFMVTKSFMTELTLMA